MANKFGRTYSLTIDTNNPGLPPIVIAPPFTIEIDVTRNVLNSLNVAVVKIYNLSPQHRNLLLKDFYDTTLNRTLVLQAGYGNALNLPTIFYGTIFQSFSRRIGTNFITEITAQSGGFALPKINTQTVFPPSTDQVVIESLVQTLATGTKLSPGYIGSFPNKSLTSRSFSETVYEALQTLSGNGVFIDNNFINVINQGESIPTPDPIVVDSSMGLLETPSREQNNMTIPVLFSPEIRPGYNINLMSTTIETVHSNGLGVNFNGIQKVNSVHHVGTISDAVCGTLITELGIIWGIPAVGATG